MTTKELIKRLHMLRVIMEHQGDTSLTDVQVPASLVFFDLMNVLELPAHAQLYVLGMDNAWRLHREYGIEWEEV